MNSEHKSWSVEPQDESSDGEEGEGTMGFSPVNIGENKGRGGDGTKSSIQSSTHSLDDVKK
jgi:hypothetical protein